jgi:hypothetical protein
MAPTPVAPPVSRPFDLEREAAARNAARLRDRSPVEVLRWSNPSPSTEAMIRPATGDPDRAWARTRQAVAGLRMKEAECRYWREQVGQVDSDVIADNLTQHRCYRE